MRLTDLKPQFLKIADPKTWEKVSTIAEADGVEFLCPACFKTNNGPIGTHAIVCWRPRVDQSHFPTGGRWNLEGTGLQDLTLVARSASVSLSTAPCKAHFFIRKGEIVFC